MAEDNILTQRQINGIYKMVGQAFSEDLAGNLQLDIEQMRKQVAVILKNMHLTEVKHSSNNKHKGWKIINLSPRVRSLSMRGYLLIFKFREYLLEEKIDYRYYYEDNEGNSKVTEFTEDNIAQYIKFSNIGIQINPAMAKYATAAEDYNKYVNYYFRMYTNPEINNYTRKISSWGRIVRSNIMAQYYHSNPGLKTKEGRYQVFNKGHIYEAIDTSLSRGIQEEKITDQAIENYVYGKYLALDNIRASQGGDNPITNTSIKSGGADLYDFYTIKTQLEQILKILNFGTISQEQMIEIITKNFMHKSKYNNINEFEQTAQKAANKLMKDIEKQLKLD